MNSVKTFFKRMFSRWEGDQKEQTFYVKMVFSLASGIFCSLGGQAFAGVRGLMLGLLIYVISVYFIVYILDVHPDEVGGRQKLITNALPSYLLLWVLIWTLLYAFVVPEAIIENLAFLVTSKVLWT